MNFLSSVLRNLYDLISVSRSTVPQRSCVLFPCLSLCSHYFLYEVVPCCILPLQIYISFKFNLRLTASGASWTMEYLVTLLNLLAVKLLSLWSIWHLYSWGQKCFIIQNCFLGAHTVDCATSPVGLGIAPCKKKQIYLLSEIKTKFIASGLLFSCLKGKGLQICISVVSCLLTSL